MYLNKHSAAWEALSAPCLYMNYNSNLQAVPWKDSISDALPALKGTEYTIPVFATSGYRLLTCSLASLGQSANALWQPLLPAGEHTEQAPLGPRKLLRPDPMRYANGMMSRWTQR